MAPNSSPKNPKKDARSGRLLGISNAPRFARFGCQNRFTHNRLGDLGILLQVFCQEVTERRVDDTFDFAIAQLGLGLTFELWMRHPQ